MARTRPGPGPIPQVAGYTDLRRLPGGHTHEMYLGRAVERPEEDLVLRVFGSGTRRRGPEAPGVQSAVLRLGQGLLPVPEFVEVRRKDVDGVVCSSPPSCRGCRWLRCWPRPRPISSTDSGPAWAPCSAGWPAWR